MPYLAGICIPLPKSMTRIVDNHSFWNLEIQTAEGKILQKAQTFPSSSRRPRPTLRSSTIPKRSANTCALWWYWVCISGFLSMSYIALLSASQSSSVLWTAGMISWSRRGDHLLPLRGHTVCFGLCRFFGFYYLHRVVSLRREWRWVLSEEAPKQL